ncbi:MAG: glutathione S-transferase N-terminal domain-containing protein [Myxococcaceae bacterium]
MIDLYFWRTPNGQKISIALEELGLPYNVKPINIGKGDQFQPEFLAISPNNRIPAIVDLAPADGGDPIPVFESGAILLYLAEKTGQLMPKDVRGRVQVQQWLMWQMSGLGPMSGQANHFVAYAPEKIPYGIERYTKEVLRLYGVMDRQLAERSFLAGEYSIADLACYPWTTSCERLNLDISPFKNLQRWMKEVGARPAVQRGLQVGKELHAPMDDEAKRVLFGQGPEAGAQKSDRH